MEPHRSVIEHCSSVWRSSLPGKGPPQAPQPSEGRVVQTGTERSCTPPPGKARNRSASLLLILEALIVSCWFVTEVFPRGSREHRSGRAVFLRKVGGERASLLPQSLASSPRVAVLFAVEFGRVSNIKRP